MVALIWVTKEELMRESDIPVDAKLEEDIRQSYKQYVEEKVPLEYILWHVDFLGRSFHVWPATLIPRPETEYMIVAVAEHLSEQWWNWNILDLWCGCGVLGASVYAECPDQVKHVFSSDVSEDALQVAAKNLATYIPKRSEYTLCKSDMLSDQAIHTYLEQHTSCCIVANLPYIPDELFDTNTDEWVKKREPRMAFVWGDDGLDYYRIMFSQLQEIEHTTPLPMFLEMMTWQAEKLQQEYEWVLQFTFVKTFHCNIRIVLAEFV